MNSKSSLFEGVNHNQDSIDEVGRAKKFNISVKYCQVGVSPLKLEILYHFNTQIEEITS